MKPKRPGGPGYAKRWKQSPLPPHQPLQRLRTPSVASGVPLQQPISNEVQSKSFTPSPKLKKSSDEGGNSKGFLA